MPCDLCAWRNPSISRSSTSFRHSQPMLGSQVPGGAGSSPSLAQGTADHPCPCDTSVTPTSALFQAGDVSAGSCRWLMMTAGNVASPWREELCTVPVFCWEQRTGRCFCGSAEFRMGSVKRVEFAFPWHNSSGCVRTAPGTGHTWLSSLGASPFSWMGRKCCCVAPSCHSCSGCAGSVTLVWKVGGANL